MCEMSFRVSFCSCFFFLVLLVLRFPRLGKRGLVLFVRLFGLCLRFPLSLGVWEGLRFVIADDLLNIDNIYFDQMVDWIYPTELKLNRANSSDTEAPFLDLNLCLSNGTVTTKIYD